MQEEDKTTLKLSDSKSIGKARKHTVVETAKGKLYVCKLCNEKFDKSYSLANHVKSFCTQRTLLKKEASVIDADEQGSKLFLDDHNPSISSESKPLKNRPQRTSKRQKANQEKEGHHHHHYVPPVISPPVEPYYDNPLRGINPTTSSYPEEYEKTFLASYPLDLVFKLKSLKALQLAYESSLITVEQFTAKQSAFVQSISF